LRHLKAVDAITKSSGDVLLPDNQKEPYQAATKGLFMASDGMILAQRLDEIVRMRMILHPKDWKAESVLMMNRWFDYRFTSPLSLTLQFGEIYREKLRAHIRRHEDVGKAETVSGTREGLPHEPAKWFTILWKARQRADEFFLPYDEYIEFCFDFSSRRKRYWTMLPSQLHPSLKNREAWLESFDRFYADRITALVKNAGEIPSIAWRMILACQPRCSFGRLCSPKCRFPAAEWQIRLRSAYVRSDISILLPHSDVSRRTIVRR
jgi:hypothetical protein